MQEKYPYSIRDLWISDPCILADPATRHYYTYAQFIDEVRFPECAQREPCFYAYESEDLIHWTAPQVVFRKGDFWADRDYWAPETHLYKGRYYLISSFRAEGSYRRCQCLAADSPLGPFQPIGDPVTPAGWHCLDGTLYVSPSGQAWMVFCHEWLQVNDGQICAIPLSDDLSHAAGKPTVLFRASDAPWRKREMSANGHGFVTDGPFLYRMRSGVLIMLWSNFTYNGGYTTGYARSRSGDILGPWVQEPDPLYAMDGAHSMLFHTFEGQLMMALHCPNIHSDKRILLFEMDEEGDKMRIYNEVTGNWYQNIRGMAGDYRYREPIREPACFRDGRQIPL